MEITEMPEQRRANDAAQFPQQSPETMALAQIAQEAVRDIYQRTSQTEIVVLIRKPDRGVVVASNIMCQHFIEELLHVVATAPDAQHVGTATYQPNSKAPGNAGSN